MTRTRPRKTQAVRRLAAALLALAALASMLVYLSRGQRVFADQDVLRQTTIVSYPIGQPVKVAFRGLPQFPDMTGEAIVRASQYETQIEMSAAKLPPPYELGAGYATYVMWAVLSSGQFENLGELERAGDSAFDAKLTVDVDFEKFALIVTAEPYSEVELPSQMVVLESIPPKASTGKLPAPQRIRYRTRSNDFFKDTKTAQISKADYSGSPSEILQARQALALAKFSNAKEFAINELDEAEVMTAEAELSLRNGNDSATVKRDAMRAIYASRNAMETASYKKWAAQASNNVNRPQTNSTGNFGSSNNTWTSQVNGLDPRYISANVDPGWNTQANMRATNSTGNTAVSPSPEPTFAISSANSNSNSSAPVNSAAAILAQKKHLEEQIGDLTEKITVSRAFLQDKMTKAAAYDRAIEQLRSTEAAAATASEKVGAREQRERLATVEAALKAEFEADAKFIDELTRQKATLERMVSAIGENLPGVGPDPVRPADDPSTVRVSRYPSVETKDEVTVNEKFAVTVSLSEEILTPQVIVKSVDSGTEKKPGGAIEIVLPNMPEIKEWELDVVLTTPGGDLTIEGQNTATIKLPRVGDSTVARFSLVAKAISEPEKRSKIGVAFFNKLTGAFLVKIERPITIRQPAGTGNGSPGVAPLADPSLVRSVVPSPSAPVPQPSAADGRVAELEAQLAALKKNAENNIGLNFKVVPPDMTVMIDTGRNSTQPLNSWITISSPHFATKIVNGQFSTPADLPKFIESEFTVFSSRSGRDVTPFKTGPVAVQDTQALMRGFGEKLYDRFAPEQFKKAFWELRDRLGDKFKTILIITDDPTVPWELMRPRRDMNSPAVEFLGLDYTVARLHDPSGKSFSDNQPQSTAVNGITLIAPNYSDALALQMVAREVDFIEKLTIFNGLDGVLPMDGSANQLGNVLGKMPAHIIHFAGHGTQRTDAGGVSSEAVKLDDMDLSPDQWRGMMTRGGPNRPFFFLNACEVGRSSRFSGFVDGFAPAVLESGASGFIGALWSIGDTGAEKFAESFYGQMAMELRDNHSVVMADLMRRTKREYLKNNDPTFLAYVFYGDPNLRLTSSKPVGGETATVGAAAPPKTISGGVLNGKAYELPMPVMSERARKAKASGPVTVQVVVDVSGNVISAKAVSGDPLLQASAEAAALLAKFKVTKLSGVAYSVTGVIVYNFPK